MNEKTLTTSVIVLDEEYQISTLPSQQEALIKAANFLDSRMRCMREKSALSGTTKIAIITAINLAHELLATDQKAKHLQNESQQQSQMLQQLTLQLENVLTEHDMTL